MAKQKSTRYMVYNVRTFNTTGLRKAAMRAETRENARNFVRRFNSGTFKIFDNLNNCDIS